MKGSQRKRQWLRFLALVLLGVLFSALLVSVVAARRPMAAEAPPRAAGLTAIDISAKAQPALDRLGIAYQDQPRAGVLRAAASAPQLAALGREGIAYTAAAVFTPMPTSTPTRTATRPARSTATATRILTPTSTRTRTATTSAGAHRRYLPLIMRQHRPTGVWVVNRTEDADDSACSAAHCTLREAINAANLHAGPDRITFNIPAGDPGRDAAGVCVIRPQSLLPFLTDNATTIDGFTQSGASAGSPLVLKIVLDGHNNGLFSGLAIRSGANVIRGLVIGRFTPFTGIDISGAPAQRNRVELCYIGTDVSGNLDWGNGTLPYSSAGIWIKEGAQRNVIGPNNLIAYNSIGVWVTDSASVGNTITRNRIRSNDDKGITLYDIAIEEPVISTIFPGAVHGTACAGCTVELFSDAGDEGAIYEGTAVANGAGQWVLNKAAGFAGPFLTATMTNLAGTTSEFSAPMHK